MSNEANMVTIYLFGKAYEVPDNLTIMKAMEYCGYMLTHGVGCRHGFCGACSTVYRIRREKELHYCLACETKVKNDMFIASLPYFPMDRRRYDIGFVEPDARIMMDLYPEIYSCVSCNTCTNTCTQGLNVMKYIHDAQAGDFAACADESFDCIMCGCCSSRCPAGISHPQVAMLARRLNGRYVEKDADHLMDRVAEIQSGQTEEAIRALMAQSEDELRELYNAREIEK